MKSFSRRPLALVTGASSGIGYNLARVAAQRGYDLIVGADQLLDEAVGDFRALGAEVEAFQVELASREGVDRLNTQATTIIMKEPSRNPSSGETKMNATVFHMPEAISAPEPALAMTAPTMPPMSACDELLGMP